MSQFVRPLGGPIPLRVCAQSSIAKKSYLRLALAKLPEDQREAIILVGASGFSYREAAQISGTAVGTVKSRVSRARDRLAALLGADRAAVGAMDTDVSVPKWQRTLRRNE